ncbi:ATP phosphoribosyltransferase regulatory subunit [Oscillatoria sp. FACHB-1406]|uniref:ATP phosphoribosyltransferase regulatory subunit n=1 Tax=Oscillatoria sp. FACHB-1406 TaxID=2692846 RepID=UPI0016864316|nr:ATP phosphoribosyltransferase regulatory subunit [Oscillatoria sp. FACHB-1406]MBD2576987.1 ATP phosphoribosyltransferase regulatory subunit [Oscillatoria sp. FACHB-1406]
MSHQPPAGARDLLPLEVVQKRWIADRLQQVFHRWGYRRIVTSTLESMETLMAGGAIQRSTVLQLEDSSEGTLGLRPELTASIARAAVTRMADEGFPQRLYYNANVFRRQPEARGQQIEFYQSGVELLFAGGVLADAEILLLLAECLQNLGLQDWHLILGEAELTRSLLGTFPIAVQGKIRYCLANLDRIALEKLPLSAELRDRALMLFDLRGEPMAVLQKVASLGLDPAGQEIVSKLKSAIDLLQNGSAVPISVTLDLSLIQTLDYYTGIVFEVINTENRRILGNGGRYDRLLGLYNPRGESSPGIGFALNLEDLHACLLSSPELPQQPPRIDWLVIPEVPQAATAAFAYAQKLRRDSERLVRVELDLGGREPEAIRSYARACQIGCLAWVKGDGTPVIEALN